MSGQQIDSVPQQQNPPANGESTVNVGRETNAATITVAESVVRFIASQESADSSSHEVQQTSGVEDNYGDHDGSPNMGNVTEISLIRVLPEESYSGETNSMLTAGAAYTVGGSTRDLTEQFLAAEQTAQELVANAMNDLF
ncbi:unnamed protein product [Enterobius vermicularis]|uniref:Uncharacterized protein n=1 Tax=Enterobius vermicularis TaxID=51028 RepID=A0A0N4VF45_ENTVE|nr:unnamed protein product [Enterobius vermicularis]